MLARLLRKTARATQRPMQSGPTACVESLALEPERAPASQVTDEPWFPRNQVGRVHLQMEREQPTRCQQIGRVSP